MTPEAERLHGALLDAYPRWIHTRLDERGIAPPPGVEGAIVAGAALLDELLRALFSVQPGEQRRTPLELFREALRAPTEALRAAGVPPVERDELQVAALPEDPYDLAPGSSEELGEDVWAAHLAWGVAKAEDVAGMVPVSPASNHAAARPAAVLISSDLMDRSKIQSVAEELGFDLVVARNPGAVAAAIERRPVVAFVDITHPAADDAIRSLAAVTRRTIVFGPHVDDVALIRAKTLGAADAVPRSRFFSHLPDWFPTLV
jgi:hypothetical protein